MKRFCYAPEILKYASLSNFFDRMDLLEAALDVFMKEMTDVDKK